MVSIIVTTYNYAHYLPETLGSVIKQTYQDWECIVVDGGSSDNTREVMNQFVNSDKRFIYIYKANEGVSASRNAGIKIARGEFVVIAGDRIPVATHLRANLRSTPRVVSANFLGKPARFPIGARRSQAA